MAEQPDAADSRLDDSARPLDPQVAQVLQTLQGALDGNGLPNAYSRKALARLLDRQTEFLEDLGKEAVRIARLSRIDEVQPVHVDEAESVLRVPRRRGRREIEIGGGLLWGLASSFLIEDWFTQTAAIWQVTLAISVLVIATAMIAGSVVISERSR
jgi:hypothetical protein